MSLFQITLQKIAESLSFKESSKELIIGVINEYLHTNFSANSLTIVNQKVFIQAPPTVKLVIRLHEKEILENLKEKNILLFSIQ